MPSRAKLQIENNYFGVGKTSILSSRHSYCSLSSSSSLDRDVDTPLLLDKYPPTISDPLTKKLETDVKISIIAYDSVKIVKQSKVLHTDYFECRE